MTCMDSPRPARPAPEPTPVPVSKATAAMAPSPVARIALGIGHIYRDKSDGTLWTLSGLRARHTVILSSNDPGSAFRDRVTLDTLADDYEYTGCDHENFCCQTHRHHIALHRGCMMR
jgi:hypothetical protein